MKLRVKRIIFMPWGIGRCVVSVANAFPNRPKFIDKS